MEWINVNDRLPDNEVLAIGYQQEMIICWVSKDERDCFFCENDNEVLPNVTHWMPLPEPPK